MVMVDMNGKRDALQSLVSSGVLTQEEMDKCIKALSKDVVFEDSRILITYENMEKYDNVDDDGEPEPGFCLYFNFAIHNKTSDKIKVYAKNVAYNDLILFEKETICWGATPNGIDTGSFHVFSDFLEMIKVDDLEDLHTIDFNICYEIETENTVHEGGWKLIEINEEGVR